MTGSGPRPTAIKRLGTHSVDIVWSDGHRSTYPNYHLRNHCPCAECRERPPRVVPVVQDGASDLYPVQIGVVGRYAVAIQWSDGHDTGIYSYQTLRSACPCPSCQPPVREGDPTPHGDDREHS